MPSINYNEIMGKRATMTNRSIWFANFFSLNEDVEFFEILTIFTIFLNYGLSKFYPKM
jgi:hypothetical protein